jgi:peptide/nickel transport system substrate-binding protein
LTFRLFQTIGTDLQKYRTVRVRVISDMNALQAELRAGRVDIAPMPTSLSPDAVKLLEKDPNLQVNAFPGSNVVLLTLNTSSSPLDNAKVRQAIAYAVDRENIIKNLLLSYGKIAHSIIPKNPGRTHRGRNTLTIRQWLRRYLMSRLQGSRR